MNGESKTTSVCFYLSTSRSDHMELASYYESWLYPKGDMSITFEGLYWAPCNIHLATKLAGLQKTPPHKVSMMSLINLVLRAFPFFVGPPQRREKPWEQGWSLISKCREGQKLTTSQL